MKKLKKYLTVFALCLTCSIPVYASDSVESPDVTPVPVETPVPTETPTPAVKNGWYSFGTQKRYYVNGLYYTGRHKIEGKYYYFDKNGILKTKTVKSGNTKYYCSSNGILEMIQKGKVFYYPNNKKITGIKKIDGKYHYMYNGVIQKKRFKKGNYTYFCTSKGILDAWRKNTIFFNPAGKKLSGVNKIEGNYYCFKNGVKLTGTYTYKGITYYSSGTGIIKTRRQGNNFYYGNGKEMSYEDATLQRAKIIVNQITSPGASMDQKLYTCFNWVIKHYYYTRRSFQNQPSWPAVYANDYLATPTGQFDGSYLWSTKYFYDMSARGNCFSDGCAFAYLAKAIGYSNVKVCADANSSHAHCWAEINGLVYDPLFAEVHKPFGTYGAAYGNYPLHPVVRVLI
ncbi:MAG: hypothetical protein SO401_00645 [Blautia sp.]|nr:hypothetical protein [Blautia sp.]